MQYATVAVVTDECKDVVPILTSSATTQVRLNDVVTWIRRDGKPGVKGVVFDVYEDESKVGVSWPGHDTLMIHSIERVSLYGRRVTR